VNLTKGLDPVQMEEVIENARGNRVRLANDFIEAKRRNIEAKQFDIGDVERAYTKTKRRGRTTGADTERVDNAEPRNVRTNLDQYESIASFKRAIATAEHSPKQHEKGIEK